MNPEKLIKELKEKNPLTKYFDPNNPTAIKKRIKDRIGIYVIGNWLDDSDLMSQAFLWAGIEDGIQNDLFKEMLDRSFDFFRKEFNGSSKEDKRRIIVNYLKIKDRVYEIEKKFWDFQRPIRKYLELSTKENNSISPEVKLEESFTYIGKVTEQCCGFYLIYLLAIIKKKDIEEYFYEDFGNIVNQFSEEFKKLLVLSDDAELKKISFHHWRNIVQHGGYEFRKNKIVKLVIKNKREKSEKIYYPKYTNIYSVGARLNVIYDSLHTFFMLCAMNIEKALTNPDYKEIINELSNNEKMQATVFIEPKAKKRNQKKVMLSFNRFEELKIINLFSMFYCQGYALEKIKINSDGIKILIIDLRDKVGSLEDVFKMTLLAWIHYRRNISIIVHDKSNELYETVFAQNELCESAFNGKITPTEYCEELFEVNGFNEKYDL